MIPVVIMLGAPGSGKGTQAALIQREFNLRIISTGDLIRREIDTTTKNGLVFKSFIENGQLVPDEYMGDIVTKYLKLNTHSDGYLLDGFPRTVFQAKLLDSLLSNFKDIKLTILFFQIAYSELLQRVVGRVICSKCKKVFHETFNPPSKSNRCEDCPNTMIKRSDDTEKTLENRYKIFKTNNTPIINYYGEKVIVIDAAKPSNSITQKICEIIRHDSI